MPITKAEVRLAFNYRPDDGGNRHDRLCADLCSDWCGCPSIIVLAPLLQGLATGGEFASATSFLIERSRAEALVAFFASLGFVGA